MNALKYLWGCGKCPSSVCCDFQCGWISLKMRYKLSSSKTTQRDTDLLFFHFLSAVLILSGKPLTFTSSSLFLFCFLCLSNCQRAAMFLCLQRHSQRRTAWFYCPLWRLWSSKTYKKCALSLLYQNLSALYLNIFHLKLLRMVQNERNEVTMLHFF